MNDAARLRVWRLIVQIRQLRMERARRALRDAHERVRRAADDTARQRDALAAHRAARRQIVAACTFGQRGASLWRVALQRHDAGAFALDAALAAARNGEVRAAVRLRSAQQLLQRELRALDIAREHVRELVAARCEEPDADD